MMVKVLFFGVISSTLGIRHVELEFNSPSGTLLVKELMLDLIKRYPTLPDTPYIVAVNHVQAGPDAEIKDNDEVAIMPPFSGG